MCYRCFWPQELCWCNSIAAMPTRSKFVILMHPKEFKREKANTGRLASLCLQNSEIHMGLCFDEHQRVGQLLADSCYKPVLLYPGVDAIVLDRQDPTSVQHRSMFFETGKPLLIFVLDATWSCASSMLRRNSRLGCLPRITFSADQKSRYTIKKQPADYCLSTLEACHQVLLLLELNGQDIYPDKNLMIEVFDRMQNYQILRENKNTIARAAINSNY